MDKKYLKTKLKNEGGKLRFIVTDESTDRHGDSLVVDQWDLKAFKKAPRMLVDHDHRVEKIVGKWKNIKIEKGSKRRMTMEAVFHGITDLSRQVEKMVAEGFLDTVSVGFIPYPAKDEKSSPRNELIEVSLVTVPANPNAQQIKSLLDTEEKNLNAENIKKFLEPEYSGQVTIKHSEVQNIRFSKRIFNDIEKANKWAGDRGFILKHVEERKNAYYFKQFEDQECTEWSQRSIKLDDGVQAVSCKRVKSINTSDAISEKRSDTQKNESPKESVRKGRSLDNRKLIEKRQQRILRAGLKEAGQKISNALHEVNKLNKQ